MFACVAFAEVLLCAKEPRSNMFLFRKIPSYKAKYLIKQFIQQQ